MPTVIVRRWGEDQYHWFPPTKEGYRQALELRKQAEQDRRFVAWLGEQQPGEERR